MATWKTIQSQIQALTKKAQQVQNQKKACQADSALLRKLGDGAAGER